MYSKRPKITAIFLFLLIGFSTYFYMKPRHFVGMRIGDRNWLSKMDIEKMNKIHVQLLKVRSKSPMKKIKPGIDEVDSGTSSIKFQLEAALKQATTKLTILVWHPPSYFKPQIERLPYDCGSCDVTVDRSQLGEATTKVVVFHFDGVDLNKFPPKRRTDQYYTWWTAESPIALYRFRNLDLREYDGVFNLTMTYRRDADVYAPYGSSDQIHSKHARFKLPLTEGELVTFVRQKSFTAVWVASNCAFTKGAKERMRYVEELRKSGLHLDLGGKCFNLLYKEFDWSRYKFYLAFENSWHCADYITEKFWQNSLAYGAVPVVIGPSKEDYSAVAPPNSFIYAFDFATPKRLVEYLEYLSRNATAYRAYLEWMTMEKSEMPNAERKSGWCQLCRILHGINVDNLYDRKDDKRLEGVPLFGHPERPRVVSSLNQYFYPNREAVCLAP